MSDDDDDGSNKACNTRIPRFAVVAERAADSGSVCIVVIATGMMTFIPGEHHAMVEEKSTTNNSLSMTETEHSRSRVRKMRFATRMGMGDSPSVRIK